jgi:hypothetical protein
VAYRDSDLFIELFVKPALAKGAGDPERNIRIRAPPLVLRSQNPTNHSGDAFQVYVSRVSCLRPV